MLQEKLYAETYVKRRITFGTQAKKALLILATLLALAAGIIVNPLILILAVALVMVDYFLMPMFKVDYEYIFCDGQLDFDKIYGGDKRKQALRVDFDNMTIMAPKASHALDSYRYNKIKVVDFTTLNGDEGVFGLVINGEQGSMLIYFEPNEKMLSKMKQKAPRKISDC